MFKKKPSHLKLLKLENDRPQSFGPTASKVKCPVPGLGLLLLACEKIQSSNKNVKLLSLALGAFCVFVAALSAWQIPSLNTSYSIKQFFPQGHPLFKEAKEIQNTFFMEDSSGFLVVLTLPHEASKTWLEPSQIQTLKKVTAELKTLPHVKNVFSLTEVEGLFESQKTLTIGSIFDNVAPDQWKNYVKSQPLISKQLLTDDFKSTLVLAEPEVLSPAAMVEISKTLQQKIKEVDSGLQVQIGGVPAIQGQFANRLMSELKVYLGLCFVIFCMVFYLLVRGRGALFLVFSSLALGNTLALGLMSYLEIPFSVLSTALPIILSLVIVSLCVHCLHRWAQRLEWLSQTKTSLELKDRFALSLEVLKDLALPNFLGSLTTAVGFISLAASPIPMIRQFGWSVSLAVMGGWALAHMVLAGFMFLTTPRLPKRKTSSSPWSLIPMRFGKKAALIMILITMSLGFLGTHIQFSGRLFDDLPKQETSRQVTENIDRNFGGVVSYDLVLKSSKDHFFKDHENALKVASLEESISSVAGVGSSATFTDLLGEKGMNSPEKLAETLFLFSLSSQNPLRNYITEDGKTLRYAVRLRDLPADQVKDLRRSIVAQVKSVFPHAEIIEGGLSVRAHVINEEVSKSLIFGFVESLVLIGLFLIFIFRSVRWAVVACIPNFVPPAVMLGTMAFLETPIKPTIALIFSIALGLAFNNTLYFLGRLKKICGKTPPNSQHLSQALLQEAMPCLFETLLSFFGFMIFLSSSFHVNQTFGAYMLLSVFSAYIADLVFLPLLLKSFPLLGKAKSLPTETVEEESKKASLSKVAAGLALVVLGAASLTPSRSLATPSPELTTLLKKVEKKVEAHDDQAHVKMVITEANGQKKEREMTLQTLRDDRFYARVNILSPADVKGMRFLAQVSKEDENQWIYIPSTRTVRRVVGGNKNAGILGSELTMEDLDPTALRASNVTIKSKDATKIILEVIPEKGTSPYTRVLTAISSKQYVPLRVVYYKGKKVAKTVDFKNYKKVKGGLWRAQKVSVKNLENKRGTMLVLSDMKTNSGLSKDVFSQNALKFN